MHKMYSGVQQKGSVSCIHRTSAVIDLGAWHLIVQKGSRYLTYRTSFITSTSSFGASLTCDIDKKMPINRIILVIKKWFDNFSWLLLGGMCFTIYTCAPVLWWTAHGRYHLTTFPCATYNHELPHSCKSIFPLWVKPSSSISPGIELHVIHSWPCVSLHTISLLALPSAIIYLIHT